MAAGYSRRRVHQFQVEVTDIEGQSILSDIYTFNVIGRTPRTHNTTETVRAQIVPESRADPCATFSFSGKAIPDHIAMNPNSFLELTGSFDGTDEIEIALVSENMKLGVFTAEANTKSECRRTD